MCSQHRKILFHSEIYANNAKPVSRRKSHSLAFIRSDEGVFEFALGIINGKTRRMDTLAAPAPRGTWNTMLLLLEASIHLHASRGTCLDTRFIINAAAFSAARSADRLGFDTIIAMRTVVTGIKSFNSNEKSLYNRSICLSSYKSYLKESIAIVN